MNLVSNIVVVTCSLLSDKDSAHRLHGIVCVQKCT